MNFFNYIKNILLVITLTTITALATYLINENAIIDKRLKNIYTIQTGSNTLTVIDILGKPDYIERITEDVFIYWYQTASTMNFAQSQKFTPVLFEGYTVSGSGHTYLNCFIQAGITILHDYMNKNGNQFYGQKQEIKKPIETRQSPAPALFFGAMIATLTLVMVSAFNS